MKATKMEESINERPLCVRTCAEVFVRIISQQSWVGTLYRLENRFRKVNHRTLSPFSLGGAPVC